MANISSINGNPIVVGTSGIEDGAVSTAKVGTIDGTVLSDESVHVEKLNGDCFEQIQDIMSFANGAEFLTLRQGYYISDNVEVGGTVSLTPLASSTYSNGGYAIVECSAGDKFVINGKGTVAGRLWAFVDSDNLLVSKSGANATGSNLTLVAPEGSAKLIVCSTTNEYGYSSKGEPTITTVERIGLLAENAISGDQLASVDLGGTFATDAEAAHSLSSTDFTLSLKNVNGTQLSSVPLTSQARAALDGRYAASITLGGGESSHNYIYLQDRDGNNLSSEHIGAYYARREWAISSASISVSGSTFTIHFKNRDGEEVDSVSFTVS